jgi:hypothetical protein
LSKFKQYWSSWECESLLHRLTFYVLLAAGSALRIAYLFQPVRNDEAYSYIAFSSNPLRVGLSFYPVPNNHLLHTFFSHFSTRLFGNNIVALRLPVLVVGILVIPATYLLVRRLANKGAALLAMGLVAASSNMINYSTQARGYIFQTLILLILVLVGLYLIDHDTIGGWVAFTILSVLGMYAIPTFLYFFPPVMIWVFASRYFKHYDRRALVKRSFMSLVSIAILTLLLYTPVLLQSGTSALTGDDFLNKGIAPVSIASFLKAMPASLHAVWTSFNLYVPWVLTLFLLLGIVVAILFYRYTSNKGYNLPLIMLVWILALYVAQHRIGFPRLFIPLIPLYLGFASIGLYALGKAGVALAKRARPLHVSPLVGYALMLFLIALLAMTVVVSQGPYQLDETGNINGSTMRDARNVTAVLKKTLKPGDVVFMVPIYGASPLEYYFRQYDIPVSYLMSDIADQAEWKKDIDKFFVPAFSSSDASSIKRAVFVTADKEGQDGNSVLERAILSGLDGVDFSEARVIYESDFAMVLVSDRIRRDPRQPDSVGTGSHPPPIPPAD